MADVFISYQHEDRAAAERVAQRLAADGLSVWWDTSLVAGDAWTDTIRAELKAARVVVVLWSSAAWASRWVQAEATAGHQRDCLVAARLDDVMLEPPFNIVQTADLRSGADGLDRLIDGIRRRTGVIAGGGAPILARSKPAEPVLAVLPFDNLSNDPEMVFFSDGVSEEVLQIVARAQGIRVIGKGSSFQFRGDNKSVRKVASELQASHVLDGSVRRSSNQIRVTAHLVEAASQTTLWTERFDRKLSDVFELQDEIAGIIADKLQAQISLRARKPVDPAAYDLYLRARREQTRQWAPDQMKTTESMLEHAVAISPDFAAAWGFLSVVRSLQIPPFRDGDGTPEQAAVLAAAHRALTLDPDCADALWANFQVLPAFSAYERKLEYTKRAATLAPSDASILSTRAFALASVGYVRDAFETHRHKAEIDPRLDWAHAQYATALMSIGQIDDGMRLLNTIHGQGHENVWVPLTRCIVLSYLAAKDERWMGEALASLEAPLPSALATSPLIVGTERMRAVFKDLLLLRGKSEAEREYSIASLLTSLPAQAVSIAICQVAAALGHSRLALRLLRDALDKGTPIVGSGGGRANTTMALFAFHASPLRRDPEFARLCARLGLAKFWQSSGHWPDCASEVPYDFKAECAKAEAEGAQNA